MAEEDSTLKDLKTLIGLKTNDDDDFLKLIIKNTKSGLLMRLRLPPMDSIPEELRYIVSEVAVRRYNRRENEGMSAASHDGLSLTFNSDDFADFQPDIDAWLDTQKFNKASRRGKVRFINGYGGESR